MMYTASPTKTRTLKRTQDSDQLPRGLGKLPEVLLFGANAASSELRELLDQENLIVSTHKSMESAPVERKLAAVLTPPIQGENLISVVRELHAVQPQMPVFAVLGPTSRQTVEKLYKVGIEAVFFFPGEKRPLLRTLRRIAAHSSTWRSNQMSPQDIALQELIRMNINSHSVNFGSKVRVTVRQQNVVFHGEVDSLWKFPLLGELAEEIPGVENVILADLRARSGIPHHDADLERVAMRVLDAAGVDHQTLVLHVINRSLRISGSVSTSAELMRIEHLLQNLRGIEDVQNWIVVSPSEVFQDAMLTRELQDTLAEKFSRSEVDVTVFGGVAVLSGHLHSLGEARRIINTARNQRGVRRVVDKLAIAAQERAPRRLN